HTALQAWTQERGLPLADDVLPWLLRHESRNLAYLTGLLLDFDRFGLQSKRSLSLPLLRQWLQAKGGSRPRDEPLG
ncbi:MAG: DnaA regulatory inactivator Hda, partial [Betaproteobacteria bacterium]|nr:DnaA regulatory inactivator Hda [Betaproteobacteria bacterium]